MNARALRCFIEVYDKKSVAAAAREVFISPQGLSKIIKQLEYDLDTELFYRGVQGMEATEAGELLYARARHICYLLDDIKKEIGILGGNKGALHFVMTYSTMVAISYETILAFSEVNPDFRLKVEEYPDEYPIHNLFQDEADVGILLGHEGIPNCAYETLVRGRAVICVAKDHPLAGRGEISLKDLDGIDLVIKATEPGKENPLIEACRKAGFAPVVKYATGNPTSLRSSCINGKTATESIDFIELAYPHKDVIVLPIKEKIPQNIYLVSRDRDIQNRAVTKFQTYIKEHIKR